jgi:hypothetical protein
MAEPDSTLIDRHLGAFQKFAKACASLYKPIKDVYDGWVGGINSDMAAACKQAREGAAMQKTVVSEHIQSVLAGFDDWCLQEIEKLDLACCQLKNAVIVEEWRQRVTMDLQAFIKKTVKRQDLQLSIEKGMLYSLWHEDTTEVGMDYPLIADLYKGFVGVMARKPMDCVLDALVEKKEMLLLGRLFLNPLEGKQYYTNNPEIMFVFDSVLLNTVIDDKNGVVKTGNMPYMTKRSWVQNYEPLYEDVMKDLTKEGFCSANSLFDDLFYSNLDEKEKNIHSVHCYVAFDYKDAHVNRYYMNLVELFTTSLKKISCKNIVKKGGGGRKNELVQKLRC